jgi:hypothetical protein
VIDMQAKDLRERGRKCPASVAYSKLRRLDDMLQRQRQKRRVMSKTEFKEKMLMCVIAKKRGRK